MRYLIIFNLKNAMFISTWIKFMKVFSQITDIPAKLLGAKTCLHAELRT